MPSSERTKRQSQNERNRERRSGASSEYPVTPKGRPRKVVRSHFHGDDYCFNNQLDLPFPFSEEHIWMDLPGLLGLDQEKDRNTFVYEPMQLPLYLLLSLQPNIASNSFEMLQVLDSYLHLLQTYCEDVTFVPSYALAIFKSEGTVDDIGRFDWKGRHLRHIFVPCYLTSAKFTGLFLFDLRHETLTLLDSDTSYRQLDNARSSAVGEENTDPVLQEIIGLFTILLDMYVLIWKDNFVTVDKTDWHTMIDTLVPQHMTKADSPVFSSMFALFTAYGFEFATFNNDVNYWRRKLAYDLVSDKLHAIQTAVNTSSRNPDFETSATSSLSMLSDPRSPDDVSDSHRRQIVEIKREANDRADVDSKSTQTNLLLQENNVSAAQAASVNSIARHAGLYSGQIKSLLRDPENFKLDDECLYALLCSLAHRSSKNVVVVRPQVSQSLYHAIDDPTWEMNIRDNAFGDTDNYEIALFPIFDGSRLDIDSRHSLGNYEGHWMLVIHERHGQTLFFDSLKSSNRLSYLHSNIVRLLRDLDPELSSETIAVRPSRTGRQHNEQTDSTSCGFYLVLYAEAFLAHDGNTFLRNFNISTERRRLIDHLSKLFFADLAEYTSRPLDNAILGSEVYENITPVTRPDNLEQLPDLTGADTRIILPNIKYADLFFPRYPFDTDRLWLELPMLVGKNPTDLTSTIRNSIGELRLVDINRLSPNNGPNSYLNNELIDAYLLYISSNYPNVGSLSSNLLSYFFKHNRLPRSLNLAWLINFTGKLFVPLHMGRLCHWGLLVVYFREEKVISMDSLNVDHYSEYEINDFVSKIRLLLAALSGKYSGLADISQWKWTQRTDVPLQRNAIDCGVFSLLFALFIAMGREFDFIHSDISYFRRKIAQDLLSDVVQEVDDTFGLTYAVSITLNSFLLGGILESDDGDILDVQEITTRDTAPDIPLVTNQIALLCGLEKEHLENLKEDHITPMESSAILAYILFAASKLDTGNVAVVKPGFFEQAAALDSLPAFFLGDVASWDIVFFLINSSVRFVNWCICVHQKDESTVFFDPAVKHGDSHSLGPAYRSRRKQLLSKLNAAIEKLYTPYSYTGSKIDTANPADYNAKERNINEGLYALLIAESYMANFGLTKLEFFNQHDERDRVLGNMERLLHADDAFYIPRPVIPDKFVDQIIPTTSGQMPPRKSTRLIEDNEKTIRDNASVNDSLKNIYGPSDKSKDEVQRFIFADLKNCDKKHPGIPCAGFDGPHYPAYLDSGSFSRKCPFCNALLLQSEKSALCCSDGQVRLPPTQQHPKELLCLWNRDVQFTGNESQHFLARTRIYNNLVAFGYITSTSPDEHPDKCAPIVLINGEIYHYMTGCEPLSRDGLRFPRINGQLFWVDPDTAYAEREQNPLFKSMGVKENVLKSLDVMLRRDHVLAKVYKTAREQYEEKHRQALSLGLDAVPHFQITLLNQKSVPEIVKDKKLHDRQVNLPTVQEIAAIHCSNAEEPPEVKDVRLTTKEGQIIRLFNDHMLCDAACYPLIFPYGSVGFHRKIPKFSKKKVPGQTPKFISKRQYFKFIFSRRGNDVKALHHIWSLTSLAQQYIIDASFRCDREVADFIRKTQLDRRVVLPAEVKKAIKSGLRPGEELGKIVLANNHVIGSFQWCQTMYQDAIAIGLHCKKVRFLITSTSNPKWEEFKAAMNPEISKNPMDYADLLNRIFIDKDQRMLKELTEFHIMGQHLGHSRSIEFQKRGGPHSHHIHMSDIPDDAATCDRFISAEIPDIPADPNEMSPLSQEQRRYHSLVVRYMIHYCSNQSDCWNGKRCVKGFPKSFIRHTLVHADKPAEYRRRAPIDGGNTYTVPNTGVTYDNRHVIPHNRYLLLRWGGHINVEWAYGLNSAKYVFKYILKGESAAYIRTEPKKADLANDPSRSTATTSTVQQPDCPVTQSDPAKKIVDYDQLRHYFKVCYRAATTAHMKLVFSRHFAELSHEVIKLSVYEPGKNPYHFERGDEAEVLELADEEGNIASSDMAGSPLEAFFKLCRKDPDARQYTLLEACAYYRYDSVTKDGRKEFHWTKRKNVRHWQIARIYPVSPRESERFALRLLVINVKGPTSYEFLKKIKGRETSCSTFAEAARLMGILDDQTVWERTLNEAAAFMTPQQMRDLFVQIMVFAHVDNAYDLWKKFTDQFIDIRNILNEHDRAIRINRALLSISDSLEEYGLSNEKFGLPVPDFTLVEEELDEEIENFFFPSNIGSDPTDLTSNKTPGDDFYRHLNRGQKKAIDSIELALEDSKANRLKFIHGSGGVGKTKVYNTLVARCQRTRKYCLAMATTGSAATLLFGGTTVHSAFCIPANANLSATYMPQIGPLSLRFAKLKLAQIIIIDEVTMMHKALLSVVDRTLRWIKRNDTPFGGVVLVLGGDWKQLLPVVKAPFDCTMYAQIEACLQSLPLYASFDHILLTENMRAKDDPGFVDFIERLGTGKEVDADGYQPIPEEYFVDSLQDLISFVYDDGSAILDAEKAVKRLVLAPTNEEVNEVNDILQSYLKSDEKEYLACDTPIGSKTHDPYYMGDHQTEVLNSLTPSGFPPYKLTLRVGSIVLLLRNVKVVNGLCNGTRLKVTALRDNIVCCDALSGPAKERNLALHLNKFRFEHHDAWKNIHFRRLQFPIRVGYALTIQKAQGQTVERVGVYLRNDVFAAGQLYVAVSRPTLGKNLKIYAPNAIRKGKYRLVKNIVAPGLHRI